MSLYRYLWQAGIMTVLILIGAVLGIQGCGSGRRASSEAEKDHPLTYQEAVVLYENELAATKRIQASSLKEMLLHKAVEVHRKQNFDQASRTRDRLEEQLQEMLSTKSFVSAEDLKITRENLEAAQVDIAEAKKAFDEGPVYNEQKALKELEPSLRRLVWARIQKEMLANGGKRLDPLAVKEAVFRDLKMDLKEVQPTGLW